MGIVSYLLQKMEGFSIGAFENNPPTSGLFVSGNTGIGTSTPTEKLHVVGNALITGSLQSNNFSTPGNSIKIGESVIAGANDVVIGSYAGFSSTSNSVIIGYQAGQDAMGSNHVFIGRGAGIFNNGQGNIGIGIEAASYNFNVNNVVAIGYEAGKSNTLHSQFIVHQSNINSTPLIQGNFSSGRVGINTSDPQSTLHVEGSARIDGNLIINGTTRITSGGWARFANGSAVSPSISFSSSTNTGFFNNPSSNILGVSLDGQERMRINGSGNVGIGTTNPTEKLTVNGKILATEIEVVSQIQSDFVFEPDYVLMNLEDVEKFVKENKHLPGVPSMHEFAEKGQNLAEVQDLLLRKVEELTLYVLEQQKEIEELRAIIKE